VIAARRADHAGNAGALALQAIHVDKPATHLEGAAGRVFLVLDVDFGPAARGQQRPGELRGGPECLVDEPCRFLELGEREQGRAL